MTFESVIDIDDDGPEDLRVEPESDSDVDSDRALLSGGGHIMDIDSPESAFNLQVILFNTMHDRYQISRNDVRLKAFPKVA